MKITYDMQAFQSVNRIGGIGRYNHEFLSVLFSLYPENDYTLIYNRTSQLDIPLNVQKSSLLNSKVIRYLPGNDWNVLNKWIYIKNFALIGADITHILSPFEPHSHTVVPGSFLPKNTVVTLYDFIPYLFQDLYLKNKIVEWQYKERLKILSSAALILAISESTRRDAIRLFHIPEEKVINIGIAPSSEYYREEFQETRWNFLREKYGINGDFVLTVSNLDHRKNLKVLLRAYSILPAYIRSEFPLVLVTNSLFKDMENDEDIRRYLDSKKAPFTLKILYSVPDNVLRTLYNTCTLFVYASLYEGGGLPVLEAMKCGAPVAASNTSSIPEFMGRKDNLFDPARMEDITNMIKEILTNESFRSELQIYGLEHVRRITWERVVHRTMQAYALLFQN